MLSILYDAVYETLDALCILIHYAWLSFRGRVRATVQDGNWEDASTWKDGRIPCRGDLVVICGHVIKTPPGATVGTTR